MKCNSWIIAVAAAALCAAPALAGSNTLTVSGLADIWLAGQPNGTILVGGYALNDVATTNSPVLASTGLNMTAGSYLTFSATGQTDYGGCISPSPEGAGACGTFSSLSFFGISTYAGPVNALVGVFVNNNVPGGTAPSGVDFTVAGAQAQTSYGPALNQVFFIGDGLTGTGSGTVQKFIIPAGATRLFIGSSDGPGASYNNAGSFTVTVTDAPPVSTSVPAASNLVLLMTGLLLAIGGAYLLMGRRARA